MITHTDEPIDQPKDDNHDENKNDPALSVRQLLDQSFGPRRFVVPNTQIHAFINRLTIQEARDVGVKITIAMLAVTYLQIEGFEAELSKKHLDLIAGLAREHPNKRYREVMTALRHNCESRRPDLDAVLWTLTEAREMLTEFKPDLGKALLIYSQRLGLSSL